MANDKIMEIRAIEQRIWTELMAVFNGRDNTPGKKDNVIVVARWTNLCRQNAVLWLWEIG